MATIRQRAKKWQARIQRQGYPELTRSFATRQAAEKWARQAEADLDKGTYINASLAEKTTLGELIEHYILDVVPTLRGGKDDIIRLKAIARRPIACFSLSALTARQVATYRDERLREVSAGTVIRELAYISSIINHARREWGINLAQNPVSLVRKPASPKGRDRILSDDEKVRLLAELEPIQRRSTWMKPLVEFALATAMRRGELLALTWDNVDVVRRTAFLPLTKNGESRLVPLSGEALRILSTLPRTDSPRVFPINAAAVGANFAKAVKRAGLPDLHFHDLRHTAITRLALKLPNVLELAAVSGHKELRMLKRYHHPDAAALALKLG